MLNNRLQAENNIRVDLLAAEEAADVALQRMATLLTTMCAARADTKLPMQTGQTEFAQVSSAVALVGQARASLLDAHHAFVQTRADVLPTISWGDVGTCPPAKARESAAPLKAVG